MNRPLPSNPNNLETVGASLGSPTTKSPSIPLIQLGALDLTRCTRWQKCLQSGQSSASALSTGDVNRVESVNRPLPSNPNNLETVGASLGSPTTKSPSIPLIQLGALDLTRCTRWQKCLQSGQSSASALSTGNVNRGDPTLQPQQPRNCRGEPWLAHHQIPLDTFDPTRRPRFNSVSSVAKVSSVRTEQSVRTLYRQRKQGRICESPATLQPQQPRNCRGEPWLAHHQIPLDTFDPTRCPRFNSVYSVAKVS